MEDDGIFFAARDNFPSIIIIFSVLFFLTSSQVSAMPYLYLSGDGYNCIAWPLTRF